MSPEKRSPQHGIGSGLYYRESEEGEGGSKGWNDGMIDRGSEGRKRKKHRTEKKIFFGPLIGFFLSPRP